MVGGDLQTLEILLVEIEAAHEVVERGRRGGGSPEEDRRVPEDLPQDRVVENVINPLTETVLGQLPHATQADLECAVLAAEAAL